MRRSSKVIAPMGAMPRTSKSHTRRTQEQRSSHGLFLPQSGMFGSVRRSSKVIAPMGAMPRTSKSHIRRTQEQRSSENMKTRERIR